MDASKDETAVEVEIRCKAVMVASATAEAAQLPSGDTGVLITLRSAKGKSIAFAMTPTVWAELTAQPIIPAPAATG